MRPLTNRCQKASKRYCLSSPPCMVELFTLEATYLKKPPSSVPLQCADTCTVINLTHTYPTPFCTSLDTTKEPSKLSGTRVQSLVCYLAHHYSSSTDATPNVVIIIGEVHTSAFIGLASSFTDSPPNPSNPFISGDLAYVSKGKRNSGPGEVARVVYVTVHYC